MEKKMRVISFAHQDYFIAGSSLPTNEKRISNDAPNSRAFLLATLVTSMVCTFSVIVVDPVPVPQSPANILANPSKPIPLLTTPGVGGLKFTNKDVAWYVPT